MYSEPGTSPLATKPFKPLLFPSLRLQKEHFLPHHGIVFEEAERSARARPDKGHVETGLGHADQPDRYRAGLSCSEAEEIVSVVSRRITKKKKEKQTWAQAHTLFGHCVVFWLERSVRVRG